MNPLSIIRGMSSPLSITWLGHSTFLRDLPGGTRILTDPWLGNPRCPASFSKPEQLGRVTLILVSHGHSDHVTDAIPVARATGAPVVCLFELGEYLTERGLQKVKDMGMGGTQEVAGVTITMTHGYGASGTWNVTVPDLSGVNGWQNAWGMVNGGEPVDWTVTVYGGRPALLFGAAPLDGETVRFASRTSSANVADTRAVRGISARLPRRFAPSR